MSLRRCIYKNCENFINLRDKSINKHISLFGFPKDPERRQKWMELGKVSPNKPESLLHFCSDHFDKKFLSKNCIRTVLVGHAVPYPYVEPEVETYEELDSNVDYYLYDDTNKEGNNEFTERHLEQDEQNLHVESTTMLNELQDEFQNKHFQTLHLDETEELVFSSEEKNNEVNIRKRRQSNTTIQSQASSSHAKIIKTLSMQKPSRISNDKNNAKYSQQTMTAKIHTTINQNLRPTAVSKEETDIEEVIDMDKLVDVKHVTTFIYKGEEYVQMPKEHYIKEKTDLMNKLQKMENTVRAIKLHLNSIDF